MSDNDCEYRGMRLDSTAVVDWVDYETAKRWPENACVLHRWKKQVDSDAHSWTCEKHYTYAISLAADVVNTRREYLLVDSFQET